MGIRRKNVTAEQESRALKLLRTESPQQVAKTLRLSLSTIYKIRRGKGNISVPDAQTHYLCTETIGKLTNELRVFSEKLAEGLAKHQKVGTPESEAPNPIVALQNEAYALCRKGNHAWLKDPKFKGIAYELERDVESGFNTRRCLLCRLGFVEIGGRYS